MVTFRFFAHQKNDTQTRYFNVHSALKILHVGEDISSRGFFFFFQAFLVEDFLHFFFFLAGSGGGLSS